MSDPLTHDAFLGGKLQIWQPDAGYRAGTDPIFLAAAVPACPGQSVLELGCGVGVAALSLGKRVPGLSLTGIEVQSNYADLAIRNASENQVPLNVICGDVEELPQKLREQNYDHVIANPPYFDQTTLTPPQNAAKQTAHVARPGTSKKWMEIGVRRLAPRGVITLIHRIEALAELLSVVSEKCGEIEIFPIASRTNRPASRVIVRARKGSRTPLILHPPKIVHASLTHSDDKKDFSTWASAVLRDGGVF